MNPKLGATLIVTSAFFYASYGIWSRLMANGFGEFSQAWSRGLLLLIVVNLINHRSRVFRPILKADIPWLLLIALAGGLNQAPYFLGFKYLGVGTATLLFYASLVIGGYLLGKIVFAEKFTPIKITSLVLAIIGMFIIYQFHLTKGQIIPAIFTIAAGIMGSATVILPKKLTGNYPEFQIMQGYFILQVIINGAIGLLIGDSFPSFTNPVPWLAALAYAAAMLLANWAAIEGYRHFEASIGSLIGLTEIIFGLAFGIILFHESLTSTIILGTIFIIISATLPNLTNTTT